MFQNTSFISVPTSLEKILRMAATINDRIVAKLLRINATMNFDVRIVFLNKKVTIVRIKFNKAI